MHTGVGESDPLGTVVTNPWTRHRVGMNLYEFNSSQVLLVYQVVRQITERLPS